MDAATHRHHRTGPGRGHCARLVLASAARTPSPRLGRGVAQATRRARDAGALLPRTPYPRHIRRGILRDDASSPIYPLAVYKRRPHSPSRVYASAGARHCRRRAEVALALAPSVRPLIGDVPDPKSATNRSPVSPMRPYVICLPRPTPHCRRRAVAAGEGIPVRNLGPEGIYVESEGISVKLRIFPGAPLQLDSISFVCFD
jgi:hypothetical protein